MDYEAREIVAVFEGERRLNHGLKLDLDARWFMHTAPDGLLEGLRRDRYITLRITRFFYEEK